MLALGPLAFLSPLTLLALLLLPLLWWLLRVTPPAPRRVAFPAVRLLVGLYPPKGTPARTPLWLLLLRVVIAALIILGLAQPVLNPMARLSGDGPLLLVVDDGWAAARDWPARQRVMASLVEQAGRENRAVALVSAAPREAAGAAEPVDLIPAADAERRIDGLHPKPWPGDRAVLLERLREVKFNGGAEVVWLSDGLGSDSDRELAARLRRLGPLTVYRDAAERPPHLLRPPGGEGLALDLRVERPAGGFAETVQVRALDENGRLIASTPVAFAPEATAATTALTLPVELRNRVARLAIDGEATAGATLLLDERWRRRPVGLVSTGPLEDAQPLLSDLYYLERALEPFTEIYRGDIQSLLQRPLAILALPDVGALPETELAALESWVERGGLLLRFAGPRLAEADDRLLPVALRRGGRALGGAMTWDAPVHLSPFHTDSPFAGLALPQDVAIRQQVLAEPSLDLPAKTWAQLSDDTPLITGAPHGKGWLVLVHTTANAEWSNLPLSGLFVDLLRRIVAVSQGVASSDSSRPLPPLRLLDGFGQLVPPSPLARPLAASDEAPPAPGPAHPPGLYGNDDLRKSLNLGEALPALAPPPALPGGVSTSGYAESEEQALGPWLLAAALLLSLLDLLIALILRGLLRPAARQSAALLALGIGLAALAPLPGPAMAQQRDDARAVAATSQTRFAYVITDVPAVDEISRAGLQGLSRVLARRTAVEPADPMGVRLGRDELAFFPLLYWPIASQQNDLDQPAADALNRYIARGGTVLIDLREPNAGANLLGQTTGATTALRRLTRAVEIPPLTPVPPDHVLTRSFYLMQDFPGRFVGGTLWVEDTDARRHDGVASILIGANDWAGAWAVDDLGRPLAPVIPGGERQREMAFRVGVNLAMYALTGNYKADQVHVPFILERLGQ